MQQTLKTPHPFVKGRSSLEIVRDRESGLPVMVRGQVDYVRNKFAGKTVLENQALSYLSALRSVMGIERPAEEFAVTRVSEDDLGYTHVKLEQRFQNLPVYGAEILLHLKGGEIVMFNGRYYPTPGLKNTAPSVARDAAIRRALDDVGRYTAVRTLTPEERRLIAGEPAAAELVVFHPDGASDGERLAWAVTIMPNLINRWAYFIDAGSGEILQHYELVCRLHPHANTGGPPNAYPDFHFEGVWPENYGSPHRPFGDGPRSANALDLNGGNQRIETYEAGGTFFLLDASRPMFNLGASDLPNDPVGGIWTLDAQNKNPQNFGFEVFQITSPNNQWDNPKAVSAHLNAALAYEYFRSTFNRNSINGNGGTIVSIISVGDENGAAYDNAFWNGAAMFYGDGDRLFSSPLARSLDVAGHEMSHGVIQNTANLEYLGEPGALNESFADVFGVLIEGEDWLLGEDVVNRQVYRSGALRDMKDPNNGGSGLGDPGWQPAHTSEQYTGSVDNGGVHINSGIPNRAFFLFASEIGLQLAEQVYYRALDDYLVRSSRFVDMRIAIVQAAQDLGGQTAADAARRAFDAVGITGGQGGDFEPQLDPNPGMSFILYSDEDKSSLNIANTDGQALLAPWIDMGILSRPSVTDDGRFIVFVTDDRKIRFIEYDWEGDRVVRFDFIDEEPIWRNAAISKDGTKIAALEGSFDEPSSLNNSILVYDFVSLEGQWFELYNPTTAQDGAQTGDVLFADRLEWDFNGEFVLYDAFNSIGSAFGGIDYWDIGFLRAWNIEANSFGDGAIFKLFSGLEEGEIVGNATFSKNAPNIIAFDYQAEPEGDWFVLGVNFQTGDVGTIFQNSDRPGVPNYSTNDDFVLFDAVTNTGRPVLAVRQMKDDKINGSGNAQGLLADATTGVWFATGARDLSTSAGTLLDGKPLRVFPNPFIDGLTLEFDLEVPQPVRWEVFDMLGRRLTGQSFNALSGKVQEPLRLEGLAPGTYLLRVSAGKETAARKIVKGN